MKLAGCKSALNPQIVYSTDRSKAVSWCCSYFLYCFMCCDASIVVTVFNSCPPFFLFTSCVVMLAFFHLQQLPILLSVLQVVIKSGIGTQGEVSRL